MSARILAAQILSRVLFDQAFAREALDAALKKSDLDTRDQAFCTELVYGTSRWALQLESSIKRALDKPNKKIDEKILPHLLIAAYQLQHLQDTIPAHAAVNKAIEAIKKQRPGLAGFANAVLRKLGSPPHLFLDSKSTDLKKIADAYGMPLWIAEKFASELPSEEWLPAIAAFNNRPQTYYHLFSPLPPAGEGRVRVAHPFVPNAIIPERDDFASHQMSAQDPASQTAALLCAAKPGDRVIDLCAAPGGKTMILSKAVGPDGHVTAVDISGKKANRIKENATRLGLPVEVIIGDARNLSIEPADVVLLDAPCSSLGTLRRHPEIKLRLKPNDLLGLTKLQTELLDSASKLVKPGGYLVYSVCSPLAEEGKDQIAAFLERHADFSRENASATLPWLPPDAINASKELTLWPHRHETDAFFAARLRKA